MKTCLNKAVVLALAAAFFLAPGGLFAQTKRRTGSTISFGIKGGLSLPAGPSVDEDFPDYSGASPKKPVFGVFFAYNSSPKFAIQLEVLYLTQSLIIDNWMLVDDQGNIIWYGSVEESRTYIYTPVLAKFRIANKSRLTPVVLAGSALSVAVRASTKPEIFAPSEVRSFGLSLVLGAGLEAEAGRLLLCLDVRYDLGVAELNISDIAPKKNALLIMAGIGF